MHSLHSRDRLYTSSALRERIRQRAYEIYQQRGNRPGSPLDDWLQAEAEVIKARERVVDEASEESFPASDPPAY